MLIEFTIANFRSFDQGQSLNMVASSATDHRQTHAREAGVSNVEPLLLSAAIYGANGAGKSNLLRGFWTLRNLILNSAREGMRGDKLPYEPFGLNKQAPTEFEVVFVAAGKRWQYGLKYDDKRVIEEFLLVYKTQKPTRVFERSYDLASDGYHWSFQKSIDKVRFDQCSGECAAAFAEDPGQALGGEALQGSLQVKAAVGLGGLKQDGPGGLPCASCGERCGWAVEKPDRVVLGGAAKAAFGGVFQEAVEDDAHRLSDCAHVADGEVGIIGQRCARADHDGIVTQAQGVNLAAGLWPRDPAGLAGAGGGAAVE